MMSIVMYPQQPSSTTSNEVIKPSKKPSKLQKAAKNLEESLDTENPVKQADNYLNVGNELLNKNMPEKAEPYFEKAEQIYTDNNRKKEAAQSSRQLGIAQEEQNKIDAAAASYKRASSNANDATIRTLNENDAKRVSSDNEADKINLSRKNASIITTNKNSEQDNPAIRAVMVDEAVSNPTQAVISMNEALKAEKITEITIVKTAKDATEKLLKEDKTQEAITFNEEILSSLRNGNDKEALISQLLLLATLYEKKEISPQKSLEEAYQIATNLPSIKWSRTSAQALLNYYYQSGNTQKAQLLTEDFLSKIDSIIAQDSNYSDLKKFEISEQKIAQLEKEKSLQAATIKQERMINNFLILGIIGVIGFLAFVIYTNRNINIKNKKIALQSLRREMNPHFIFNSLNSINEYIVNNDERKANKFLTNYATLMRRVMENNNEDFVPLAVEIEQLSKYLALEHLRFSDKFDYEIKLQDNLNQADILIPNMVIQPYLENAIWHGLRYLNHKGLLTLSIDSNSQEIIIKIKDNGIGITASKEMKTKHQKDYKSLGMTNTKDRLKLINSLYHTRIKTDVISDSTGTEVTINIPIKSR